ncbi:putative DENN domain-containing protein [Rosellinia necatrix]|uniref:Putative DENN domain-containing protein n=1 Tax=Rosellinia necatrix TaxID=77044 RepID=A0A1S7UL07_ROSNE|nr:putative DENN domain-containing protein [Rosellinia necatrix]
MESPSAPLADYFWIAGIESVSYNDFPIPAAPNQVNATIAEDGEPDDESDTQAPPLDHKRPARHSRQNSNSRLSRTSISNSIHTLEELDGNTTSNRSSATIRPNPPPGGAGGPERPEGHIIDFDFDKALVKFAAERENFLEDLSFSAGAKTQSRPPMVNPRAERIKADEAASGRLSPLKGIGGSIRGSIRRKISFRDMNSARKQPTTPRPASVRTAKRLSNYNSVIPPPQPLNLDPDMHPLKRRFEPELLDRYPPRDAKEDPGRRGRFPDYVPMFAFPNDIQIVSSDDRPRSTWHGFTMTSDDNSKIYGITIIVWMALTMDVAEEVEKRCEQWRQSHMSEEERELAGSLGARLAAERAHLSQLLAKLPTIPSGSSARETLDEQISAVEEKISLMAEMLRPLRHGAASKIDGLTAGESGLWTPRAFGILGRDATRVGFWKDWLRAVIVPMTDGGILRVPASSPTVGRWQPLERYVVNLCTEAFSPLSSKAQVEIGVRELRLYARAEAANELPGSRNTDLYALFRSLSLENIVTLFEYAMSESRIILLSSHTSMLHLASHALANLLYPLTWASIFIPILPARLLSALDAPCPYIVGIERRYDGIELPDDDYVLVDLDKDTIDSTSQPVRLPKQIRRKLLSLLQLAAPHAIRYGVASGPPPYAIESFPYDAFSAENSSLFHEKAQPSTLGKWVAQNSSSFGELEPKETLRVPIFNAFASAKPGAADRPTTSKSNKTSPPSSVSPVSINFPPMPSTPISKSDSGFALSATLREKRSGHFDEKGRRSSSFGQPPFHRPHAPFMNGHQANLSISAISIDSQSSYGGFGGYAPSTYAQSTLAASTVMPNMLIQPVHNTETTVWVEGHCFNWSTDDIGITCTICNERSEGDGCYKCSGCEAMSHGRCLGCVSLVCPVAFNTDKIRAAFVRCQASLLYTYRKYLGRPSKEQKTNGQLYAFDMNGFIRSLPYDQQEYAGMMRDTQAFNEFIHTREMQPATNPTIRLFDEIILAKKARGKPGISSGLSRLSTIRASHGASRNLPSKSSKLPSYLTDTTDHLWRTASVPMPNAKFPGEYRAVVTRIPARLDPTLMKEPRAIQGVPRPEQRKRGVLRKQVPSMMGLPTLSFPVPTEE